MTDETHTLQSLSDKLDLLLARQGEMNAKLDGMMPQAEKMTHHIDFINGVYDQVRAPLFFVCDRVRGLAGHEAPPPAPLTRQKLPNSSVQ